ncbi:MAG: metalloregulator ArsR/SmtB family transcription factor [Actinomycetota bacterium]|nr:metalloregulator ArsR/SmtB family transcription factor [Actinomycetota bacterium]
MEYFKALVIDDLDSPQCEVNDVLETKSQLFARANEISMALAATSDPVRLKLLAFHLEAYPDALCACALVDKVERSQSTVSHHLATLVRAGWLTSERRGKWIWYRLSPVRLSLIRAIEELASSLEESIDS